MQNDMFSIKRQNPQDNYSKCKALLDFSRHKTYLIRMNKSCFSRRHYFPIDKASDLTGVKSVVGMHNCDHVPLKKYKN